MNEIKLDLSAIKQVEASKAEHKSQKLARKWKTKSISADKVTAAIKAHEGKSSSISKIFETFKQLNSAPTDISESTFYRFVKDQLGAKYLKGSLRSERVKYDSVLQKVIEFHRYFQWYLLNDFKIIFIDEATFKSDQVEQKMWMLPNADRRVLKPAKSETAYVILAVSEGGAELFHINPWTTNGDVFKDFLVNLISEIENGS